MQAAFVGMFVLMAGFWGFRRWLRSAPRAAKPLVAPTVHPAPPSGLAGEVAELRAEVARLQAERQDRGGEDVAEMSRRPDSLAPKARLSNPFYSRPPFPSPWIIPDRSSLSRVRFAASRPGPLRADLERGAVHEGKGGFGPCGRAGREPFGHTGRLEPQPRGAVTRRAVAQRRSRASGLTRPLAAAIRVLVWVVWILSRFPRSAAVCRKSLVLCFAGGVSPPLPASPARQRPPAR